MTTHYQILGLANFASIREVQKAFRRLAIQYHPDKHGGSTIFENKFKEINNSYQVLNDPVNKQKYDNILQFGFEPKATYSPPTHTTPKPPTWQKQEQIEYTEFQKVYIKVALGLVALFLTFILISHLIAKSETTIDTITALNQQIIQRFQKHIDTQEVELAEKTLDSCIAIGNSRIDYYDWQKKLLALAENGSNNDFLAKKYTSSIQKLAYLQKLCTKYDFDFEYKYKIRKLVLLSKTQADTELKEEVKLLLHAPIQNFELAFGLVDELIQNNHEQYASDLSKEFTKKFLENAQSIYGAGYTDVLESGIMNDKVLKPLVQAVCLNKNYTSNPDQVDFTEDLVRDMLFEPSDQQLFAKLKSISFQKNQAAQMIWTIDDQKSLDRFGLSGFYTKQ